MPSDHTFTGYTADTADIIAECERFNPSRGQFIPDLPVSVSTAAIQAVPLFAGELATIVTEIIGRPHGPPEWAELRRKLKGAPALADMNRWLVKIARHTPPGLTGKEVRDSLDAVQAATCAVAALEWRTGEDRDERWDVVDDLDPSNWTTIYCERVWRTDADAAKQKLGDLFGSVERLTNALAACFLADPLGGSQHGGSIDMLPEAGQAKTGVTPSRPRADVDRSTFATALLLETPSLSITEIAERVGVPRESLYKTQEFETFRKTAETLGRMTAGRSKQSAARPSGYRTVGGGIEATTDRLPASNPRPRPKSE